MMDPADERMVLALNNLITVLGDWSDTPNADVAMRAEQMKADAEALLDLLVDGNASALRAITAAIEGARAAGHPEQVIRAVILANFPGSLAIRVTEDDGPSGSPQMN